MSYTSDVAEWISNLRWEELPPEVIQQSKHCLRDFLACASGGARSTPGRISSKMATSWGGPPEATIIGASQTVAARYAAFANATMANALDYDDTLNGHPGSTTFPTVLAAAEKWKRSGKDALLATVIGYELSVRAMGLMQPIIPRYRAMWDLGTLQAYGATAAAAKLAGLSADGVANAIGLITGTAPSPLPRKERYPGEGRSMLKSAYGWAVDAAIVASELTQAGFSGPGHALDDNMGFWEVMSSEKLGLNDFSDKLGQQWAILQVAFKPFMACRFIHPVLQGIEELIRRHSVTPDSVERIDIGSFSLLTDEHHYILQPVSGTDAQFSVPYTVAAMIYGGSLSPESYSVGTLHNQDVLSLAKRVKVHVREDLDEAYPLRLGAHVRVVLKDGQKDEILIENPKGSPEDPLTDEELVLKYQSLAYPLFGQTRADEISSFVDRFEELSELEPFSRLLRTG